jgi:diguanylate cyclase (GGDEF)-like protein
MAKSKKIKILYIEDDSDIRLLMRKILSKDPFQFLEASTGLEGLEIALKKRPQLILMDIDLPDIRGDELTTKMKNTKELKDTVIIALSGLKEEHVREKILVAGATGYIRKPINVSTFPDQILRFLGGEKEVLEPHEKEYFHEQYELSIVERLTNKVQELEVSNRSLESTSQNLARNIESLQKMLGSIAALQTCQNPAEFMKVLVEEICEQFQFDRCVFLDVNHENMSLEIKYARGINRKDWKQYSYPATSPALQQFFEENQILQIQEIEQVEEPQLKALLKQLKAKQFVFAYLGTPTSQVRADEVREGVLPLLESFLPSLHNQEDMGIDNILGNLEEYLTSESLHRAGFLFMDNSQSNRTINSHDIRFLETLMRTASYMYQNLSLMDQLRFLFIKAEKEAITDPLTSLYNYRYFIHQLNREISRSQRHHSVFSLIMIDIDYFKNYNDAYGHQSGDLILHRIAQSMVENTRSSDMVCRYGGEEFCIICPELSREDAKKTAEKLRKIVEKLELPRLESVPGSRLTISSGISSFPEDGSTAYQLILNADKAMYRAKETGRNKVCAIVEES